MSWNQAHAPLLVESFPKTPRTRSEASGVDGSHKYKQTKQTTFASKIEIFEQTSNLRTLVQLNTRTFVSRLSTISRHRRQTRFWKSTTMSSKNWTQMLACVTWIGLNNGFGGGGPTTPERVKSLVAKDMKCHSYRWWWLVQLGHVLFQSITGVPPINWCTNNTSFFVGFLLIVCFCFPFGLCLLMFSFAFYFCWMGSHPFFFSFFFLGFFQPLLVLGADWFLFFYLGLGS